jgi:hypothetical protein
MLFACNEHKSDVDNLESDTTIKNEKIKVPPTTVVSTFQEMFKDASNVTWELEENNEWEVEFSYNGTVYSATFDESGSWLETEKEISVKDLPVLISNVLTANFSSYLIDEAEISETVSGITYEFEIENGELEREIEIDSEGKIIKNKLLANDQDDEEDDDVEDDDDEDDEE